MNTRCGKIRILGWLAAALCTSAAWAQGPAATTVVPLYTPGHFVQGVHRQLSAPAARELAGRSAAFVESVQALCRAAPPGEAALQAARVQWSRTLASWERLSAVAIGPLVERRSLRGIDFLPTRARLIERGIAAAPRTEADMERIGTPGKGFPALEWLLWTRPVRPATPACDYAGQLALEIDREARALAQAFDELAQRDWSDEGGGEAAAAAMTEIVNQWVGGLERLRWQRIERPVREAATQGHAPVFARAASARDAASWAAAWRTLKDLAVEQAPRPAVPGAGLVPLETYLRGRGLNPAADALRAAVMQADAPMRQADPGSPPSLPPATQALAALKRQVEAATAPALKVNIGFSDADGD